MITLILAKLTGQLAKLPAGVQIIFGSVLSILCVCAICLFVGAFLGMCDRAHDSSFDKKQTKQEKKIEKVQEEKEQVEQEQEILELEKSITNEELRHEQNQTNLLRRDADSINGRVYRNNNVSDARRKLDAALGKSNNR